MKAIAVHWGLPALFALQAAATPLMPVGLYGNSYEPNAQANPNPWHLFNGLPSPDDVQQKTVPDCWLASSIIAICKMNSHAIFKLFGTENKQDNGDPGSVPVTVYDYKTLEAKVQEVKFSDTALNDAANVFFWWPAAIEQAVRLLGGPEVTDGQLSGGRPEHALSYLTGKEGGYEPNLNQCWSFMRDHADSSPMTFNTHDNTKTLAEGHAYAVMHATEDGDAKKITLRNPWGETKEYDWVDVRLDFHDCSYLRDFPPVG